MHLHMISGTMPRRVNIHLRPATAVTGLAIVAAVALAATFLDWDWLPHYARLALRGLWCTLWLLAVTSTLGLIAGIALGLAQIQGPLLAYPAKALCTLIRGTPLLLQLWFIYFGLGSLFAQFPLLRDGSLWPILRQAWPYAVLALTLSFAAYSGEVMRGAFKAVPSGQLQAARAFGMTRPQIFRRIWLPQAIAKALPALSGEVILQLKSTPLVATITMLDSFAVATRVRQETFLTYEPLLLLAAVYLVLSTIIVALLQRLERRQPRR